MSDQLDHAQHLEERERAASVSLVRSAATDLGRPVADADCRACGDPIEEERRAACPGATRCLVCQEQFERMSRLFPRRSA